MGAHAKMRMENRPIVWPAVCPVCERDGEAEFYYNYCGTYFINVRELC